MIQPVIMPENKEVQKQFHLGQLWQKKGKLSLAIKHYQSALQNQNDYLPIYLLLGSLLLQQGNREEAQKIYRQAMQLEISDSNYSAEIVSLLTKTQKSKTIDNIVLYTDRGSVYGAEQVDHFLMCGLFNRGKKITCVQPKNDSYLVKARKKLGIDSLWLEEDNVYGYQLYKNARTAIPKAFTHPTEAVEIFAKTKPDLIVFSDSCPFSNLVAKEVAIALKIPYIIIVHLVNLDWLKQFEGYLDRLPTIYEHSLTTICVSQNNLDLLHQSFGLPENIGRVIYNGVDESFFDRSNNEKRLETRRKLDIPPEAIVCLTTARLDLVKGYQYQLEAIKLLQKSSTRSKLYFVWIGDGQHEQKFKTFVRELNIEEKIKFLGRRNDVLDLLDIGDIFILPSQVEGMPMSIAEAMAKGLPVIATRVSGIPEQLGDTGKLLSDPKIDSQATILELANTIESWSNDEQLRKNIGKNCQQRAQELFRQEQMITNYFNLINSFN